MARHNADLFTVAGEIYSFCAIVIKLTGQVGKAGGKMTKTKYNKAKKEKGLTKFNQIMLWLVCFLVDVSCRNFWILMHLISTSSHANYSIGITKITSIDMIHYLFI